MMDRVQAKLSVCPSVCLCLSPRACLCAHRHFHVFTFRKLGATRSVSRLSPPAIPPPQPLIDPQRSLRSERGTHGFRAHALPSNPCKTMHDNKDSTTDKAPPLYPRNTHITLSDISMFELPKGHVPHFPFFFIVLVLVESPCYKPLQSLQSLSLFLSLL